MNEEMCRELTINGKRYENFDEYVQEILEQWYGKENCFKISRMKYIVKENGKYFLMSSSTKQIFFTSSGKTLAVEQIQENPENLIIIEEGIKHKIKKEYFFTFATAKGWI